MSSTYHSNNQSNTVAPTPDTPRELLEQQDNMTEVQKVLFRLADMSPKENHEVLLVALGALRDWHRDEAKRLMSEGAQVALQWAAEATAYQFALRNLKTVDWGN